MDKEVYQLLIKAAEAKAKKYSDPDREQNLQWQATFSLHRVVILSEFCAVTIMKRHDKKLTDWIWFWANRGRENGRLINGWFGFIPKDSHFLGIKNLADSSIHLVIEEYNRRVNEGEEPPDELLDKGLTLADFL